MEESGLFLIDEKSGVPIWMQIRKRLIYLISSGHFARGERLPSVREMSVRFSVNYNTINKVYQDLERDGYIFTRRGLGTYVSETKEFENTGIDDEVLALANQLVEASANKGMSFDDVLELLREQHDKYTHRPPAASGEGNRHA